MKTCLHCGKQLTQTGDYCSDCSNKFEETTLLNDQAHEETVLLNSQANEETVLLHDENPSSTATTDVKTRKLDNNPKAKKKWLTISVALLAILIVALVANQVINNQTTPVANTKDVSDKESQQPAEEVAAMPPAIPAEFEQYEGTALLNDKLFYDQIFTFYGYDIKIGETTPDQLKELFQNRNFMDYTNGDEYTIIYDNIPDVNEVSFDFKRDTLIRITIVATSGEPIDVLTGNQLQLGASLDTMTSIYGDGYLPTSTAERFEYIDLASKMYVLFEDIHGHVDNQIDYIFIEKYDLAKPHSYKNFEDEKIEIEQTFN